MNKALLDEILDKHEKWLKNEPGGERANFQRANLWISDLRGANLQRANLRDANLRGANLQRANLRGANLRGVDLREADLRRADLQKADLQGADLREATLWRADLWEANLRGAGLWRANLRDANLWGADLWGADLQKANLWGADLWEANLREAYNIPDCTYPICCPEKGSFIGFKKALDKNIQVIVELEILADAKRSSATTRKCRCDKAKVLSITDLSGVAEFQIAVSNYDNDFIYEVGKTVVVDDFDENRWNECSTGIHFYITRNEAVVY